MALALLLGAGPACAPPEPGEDAVTERRDVITGSNGLALNGLALNGLALNGLALNGLALNGLALNGLALNGLALNGAATSEFATWFNSADNGNTTLHASTMKYVIACALRAGATAAFKDKNGVTHTWTGQMGLAPNWGDSPITTEERQLVSACLMGHINSALPTPKQIQISLRGPTTALTTTTIERQALATFDGAFFGDLFTSPNKIYVCDTNWGQPFAYYQTVLADWGRQCFHDPAGCGLFTRVECATNCSKGPDGSYQLCSIDGVQYKPITVFVPKMKLAREFTLSGTTASTSCTGCLDGRFVQLTGSSKATVSGLATVSSELLVDVRYSNPSKNKSGAGINALLRMQTMTSNGVVYKVLENNAENLSFPYTGAGVWKVRTVRINYPANGRVVMTGVSNSIGPMIDMVSLRLP